MDSFEVEAALLPLLATSVAGDNQAAKQDLGMRIPVLYFNQVPRFGHKYNRGVPCKGNRTDLQVFTCRLPL